MLLVVDTEVRRLLLADEVIIGAEYAAEWARDQAAFSGMALMETVAFLEPPPRAVLALGLGSGTVPAFLRDRGIETDAIDIDAAVIALAREYFYLGERGPGRTLQADARAFVRNASGVRREYGLPEQGYDALILDLYTGDNPLEMLTAEALGRLKRAWLKPSGAMVVNVVAFYAGPHVALARDVVRTLRSVFRHVRCFVDRPPHLSPDVPTNLVTYASDAPLAFAPPRGMSDQP